MSAFELLEDDLVQGQHILKMPLVVPNLNRLYNTLRTADGLEYFGDIWFFGSSTLTNGTDNNILVAPTQPPDIRLKRWPMGTQAYLLIRHFSVQCSAAAAPTGSLQCVFFDSGGAQVPLGDFPAANGGVNRVMAICPTPITDPNPANLGTLDLHWFGGTAGAGFTYSLGFGLIYLLPAKEGFKIEHVDTRIG